MVGKLRNIKFITTTVGPSNPRRRRRRKEKYIFRNTIPNLVYSYLHGRKEAKGMNGSICYYFRSGSYVSKKTMTVRRRGLHAKRRSKRSPFPFFYALCNKDKEKGLLPACWFFSDLSNVGGKSRGPAPVYWFVAWLALRRGLYTLCYQPYIRFSFFFTCAIGPWRSDSSIIQVRLQDLVKDLLLPLADIGFRQGSWWGWRLLSHSVIGTDNDMHY